MAGVVVGLLAIVSCVQGGSPGPATTTVAFKGNQPDSNVPPCVVAHTIDGLLNTVPDDLYQYSALRSRATLSGDLICANELNAPRGRRAWVFLYWVKQASGGFVIVSATIVVNTASAPPAGRPILSWAHGTQESITDGCAPSHKLPMESWWRWLYPPLMQDFLNDGFAVVATDYIGLGTPGVHPYLEGKSEGAAVLAAARAAQNFSPAQASGPVIIAGHSQGGHAALFADWQTEHIDYFAPGVDVRGVVALAPPTFLDRIATLLLANPSSNSDGVRNIVIAAGSWVRLYGLAYPPVFTDLGIDRANKASDPTEAGCYQLDASHPDQLVHSGALPLEWTDQLSANTSTAPVGLLPDTIPLLVVQGNADQQVPYPVTAAAVHLICDSGVPVQFDVIGNGDHLDPVRSRSADTLILPWVQHRLGGEVENNCASPPAQLTVYTVMRGDTLSGIAQRFHVAGGWQTLYQHNRDIITNPNLIFPGQHLFIR